MESTLSSKALHDRDAGPIGWATAYVRFWLTMLWALLWIVICGTLGTLASLLPRRLGRRFALGIAIFWARMLLWAARCPVEVEFAAPPPEGGFFYYSNHQGTLDILALFVALRRTPIIFAAKRELFSVPFVGWYLITAGFVEVDRRNRERATASYAQAARQVQEGTVLCVYPEGTRSVDGSVLPFKRGAFVLAIEAQRPVVPVAVEGAQYALRKHTLRLHGHPIRVRVGAPIPTSGLTLADRDELLRRTRRAILAQHQQLGGPTSPEEPMIAPPGKRSGERDE